MNLEYKEKYLKYKNKYLDLIGGKKSFCKNVGYTPITKKISCRKNTDISAHDAECQIKNGRCSPKKDKVTPKMSEKIKEAMKKVDNMKLNSKEELLYFVEQIYNKQLNLLNSLLKNPDKSHLVELNKTYELVTNVIEKIQKGYTDNVIDNTLSVTWITKFELLNNKVKVYIDFLDKLSDTNTEKKDDKQPVKKVTKKTTKKVKKTDGTCNDTGLACIFTDDGSSKHCNKEVATENSKECECVDVNKTGNYRCHVKKEEDTETYTTSDGSPIQVTKSKKQTKSNKALELFKKYGSRVNK